MNLDLTQIIVGVLGVACSVLGWFAHQVWQAVTDLRKDHDNLRVLISAEYVRYDRLQDAFKPIMDSLHEIKQTLAGKADKP